MMDHIKAIEDAAEAYANACTNLSELKNMKALQNCVEALSELQSAIRAGIGSGEPVAYYYKTRNSLGEEVWSTYPPLNGQGALEVRPLYLHPQPAAQSGERSDELGAPFLLHNDFCDLHRFFETSDDDESYDIPKDRMKRLAALGVVQHSGFGRYSITAFGHYVHELCWEQKPALPLLLNDDRDRIKRAAIAAQQGDSHE